MLEGKLHHGLLTEAVILFKTCPHTIKRFWNQTQLQLANENKVNLSSKRVEKVGKKCVHLSPRKIMQIPLNRRCKVRSLAKTISVPKTTVHRRVDKRFIRPHLNAVKP